MIVRPPANCPPAPKPASARPTMNTGLFGATADISEPNIKSSMINTKTLLRLNITYNLPQVGCRVVVVMRYAEPYHPTSESALKSLVICGLALINRTQGYTLQSRRLFYPRQSEIEKATTRW